MNRFGLIYLCARSFRLAGLAILCAVTQVYAAAPLADVKSLVNTVPATVTAAMGDVGGKLFGRAPDPEKTRHYYIAAEPVLWNFAPEGQDPVCGKPFPPSLLLNRVSWKIRYVQYADANFTARVLAPERLGIMGPVLRGTTGETLAVTFLNRSWLPLSMHPHGVRYDKDNEGSYYKPSPGLGAAIAPGAKFTYVWQLDAASGPGPDEPSSKAWLYHSHVTGDEEVNWGLVGFIVVTDPTRARPDGTPRDVDREMGLLFKIFDEANSSGVAVDDADDRPAVPTPAGPVQRTWSETQQILEEGQRHAINGRVFGNLSGLEMNEGERVRWYLFGLGSETDFHTAHWHGLRVVEEGRHRTDVVELLPGSMKVADQVADVPGDWLLHCHVAEHMTEGMFAKVTVHPASDTQLSRAPASAFFGMPDAQHTLRIEKAEVIIDGKDASHSAIYLDGSVTVPDPFPASRTQLTVKVGEKSFALNLDPSGLSTGADGMFLIKNSTPYGNGNVRGGEVSFELTLKGAAWLDELRRLQIVNGDGVTGQRPLEISLQIGDAQHHASCTLTRAPN